MGSGSPPSPGLVRRCVRHALAAGPDGLCALCRSESLPPPRAYQTWALGGVLLAILLVSGGAVAYRAVSAHAHAHATLAQEAPQPGAVADVQSGARVPVEAADTQAVDRLAALAASSPAIDAEPVPLPPAASATAEVAATNLAPPDAAPEQMPQAPAKAFASEVELRAALSATPIVMYSASWCGVCRKAKRFLSESGLTFREIDADLTPGAWEKVEQMIGHRGVPVIIVDGELTPAGLSPSSIMRAVSHSMERRLGVQGIRVKAN